MPYALVTGATKGIGKAIAEELAQRKIDVLLIARSIDLLQQLAEQLSETYGIQTNYFAIDLSQPNAARKVFDWCNAQSYAVNILINNAGFGLCGVFEKYSLEEHLEMTQLNMNVPLQLTYLFLPQLKLQSKSYIMNIASSAAYQAVPGLNLYAASKAFILSFSRGLQHELKGTNVSVTVVSPGPTDTDFLIRANINNERTLKLFEMFNMPAQKVASIAVNAMFKKRLEVITGWVSKLNAFFVWILPKNVVEKSAAWIYRV